MPAEEGFTVQETARQLGRSPATVRSWIAQRKLTPLPNTKPVRIAREQVLQERARILRQFDGVRDELLSIEDRGQAVGSDEAIRLRFLLRAVLTSIESFDEGLAQLRRSQRTLLDSLLQDMRDVETPPSALTGSDVRSPDVTSP